MKPKKLIRYRIPVSVKFPATHPRKGEETDFAGKIINALGWFQEGIKESKKLHTIRGNYPLWAKRFEKINRGEALLELYRWSGKPYVSKSVTICQLGKHDDIGIQELYFLNGNIYDPIIGVNEAEKSLAEISFNDGLSPEDFKAWLKGSNLSGPMAIIHFTPFRYV